VIDPSVFIAQGAVVLGDVSIGTESSVWYNAVLRGDTAPIRIGNRSNVQDLTMIHADEGVPCTIGNRVGVGHRAILHGCTVEDDTLVGMGAILLNHVVVGAGSVVGAGAVLPEGMEVAPGSLVVGVPARVIRPVDEVLRARIAANSAHYVEQARRHRGGAFPVHPSGI
jgi:carbonic anhydrase/acetyltransferase-like protein (isoleucine patch superfamily)